MRKNIFVSAHANGWGVNLYRSTMPWSELRRKKEIDIYPTNMVGWDQAAYFDMGFFSWPNSPQAIQQMGQLRAWGIPIWVDFDDDPWNLPPDNPAAKAYQAGGEVITAIEQAAKEADVITVSTERLKAVFSQHNKNVQVIPNAFWDTMWPFSKAPRKKGILWRGMLGHNKDLESVFPVIVETIEKYKDWAWVFVGEPDPELMKLLPENHIVKVPPQHPQMYMRTLYDMALPICVVPLLNHEFNRNKSHVSWLECTAAGTAVLAPSFLEEYRQPGITNYDDPAVDFKEKLWDMIDNWETLDERVENSRWAIGQKYILSQVNKTREKILGLK